MSEGYNYESTSYRPTHNFTRARRAAVDHSRRSYAKAKERKVEDYDLLPETLLTRAKFAVMLVCDQTGSMLTWPATFRSKAPYVSHEIRTEYLDPDSDISVMAFGDARNHERFPVQAREFTRGEAALTEKLKELVYVKQGGGSAHETSELVALYICRNVRTPNVVMKPLVIFITDEMPYDSVTPKMAKKAARVKIDQTILTNAIFSELRRKCEVYVILKTYQQANKRQEIFNRWAELVGEDHIAVMPDAPRIEERCVDVTFGILGHYSNKVAYFRSEIEERQTPQQVAVVYEALRPIIGPKETSGKSRMHDMDEEGQDAGRLD